MRKKKKISPAAGISMLGICAAILLIAHTAQTCFCAEEGKDRVLHSGDVLHIRIPAEPELSGDYEIMSNGKFYFPVLEDLDFGSVVADGRTIAAVEEEVRGLLTKYYADDSVVIDLISVEARPGEGISIYGKVHDPGMMKYEEGVKLMDLLMKAGDFKSSPNLHKVSLYRDNKITYLDISELVQGRDFTNNIDLKEGDVVIIPSATEYSEVKVTVLGKVGAPGTYLVSEDTLAVEAIAEAGGPVGRAAVGKTIIIRMEEGEPKVLHVDLKAMLNKADLTQNLSLRDGDIIYVPETDKFDAMKVVRDLLDLNLLKRTMKETLND